MGNLLTVSKSNSATTHGISNTIDSGVPSWNNAVKEIASKLGMDEADNLKTPQFYFNSRGKKEYVELVREIFKYDKPLEINEIHKKIIQLNTHIIITTNYDCLLEKAAAEKNEMVQVIKQDKELPYKSAEKEIIKMHGDFFADNFVLREDDYLHYGSNFRLIETYIKSLIATNVVLFIGYSFEDPDIKQIFTWIKDVLGDDFQRAYMFEAYKQFDINQANYYKHMGVNAIYASEIHKNFDAKNATKYISEFLTDILAEDEVSDDICDLWNRLAAYSDLNYVCEKYISRAFRSKKVCISNHTLISFGGEKEADKLLKSVFDCEETGGEADNIKSVISKSSIDEVSFILDNQKKKIEIRQEPHKELVEYIKSFDVRSVSALGENIKSHLDYSDPKLFLQMAYVSYALNEYRDAYRYLKICSKTFYEKKMYLWYFISEFNRLNIGNSIVNARYRAYCTPDEMTNIKSEVDTIDMDIIYAKVCNALDNKNDFLHDLYTNNLYYTIFHNVYSKSNKADTEQKKKYTLYAGNPAYEELRDLINDCLSCDLNNYIMHDMYLEEIDIYRLFSKTMLNSVTGVSISEGENDDGFSKVRNVHADSLETIDIFVIIRYLGQKEIKGIFASSNGKAIKLSDKARNYVHEITDNIFLNENQVNEYTWRFLTIAGYLELDSDLTKKIFEQLGLFLKNSERIDGLYDDLLKLIYNVDAQKQIDKSLCEGDFHEIIEDFITGIIQDKIALQHTRLLTSCLSIYEKVMKLSYSSDKLDQLINSEKYSVLSDIYLFCNRYKKAKIKRIAKKWKWINDWTQEKIYSSFVMNDILQPNEEIENDILNHINRNLLSKKNNKGILIDTDDSEIVILINLYLNNKIKNKKKVEDMINSLDNESYKWLVDINNYNYDDFKVEWLNYCSLKLLDTISKMPNVRSKIEKKVKSAYFEGTLSYETMKRFFIVL